MQFQIFFYKVLNEYSGMGYCLVLMINKIVDAQKCVCTICYKKYEYVELFGTFGIKNVLMFIPIQKPLN